MKHDGGSTDVAVRVESNLFCLSLVRFASITCFAPPGRIYIHVAGDFCVCLILARIVVSRQACAVHAAEITLSFSVSSRCTLQLLQARNHRLLSALFFPPFLFLPPFFSFLSSVFSIFVKKKKQSNRRSPQRFRACVREKESSPLWQLFR